MAISAEVRALNVENAAKAKKIYLEGRNPASGADDWHVALKESRSIIAEALRASNYLRDPAAALRKSGQHMLAFRHLLAPPCSQDQFKLLCEPWSKGSEKPGRSVSANVAPVAASIVEEWLDDAAAPWLRMQRNPTRAELRNALQRASILIAAQRVQTILRGRLSAAQETAVTERLIAMGWLQRPAKLIDTRAAVDTKTFMYKTRFATNTTAPQEVDVACGLKDTVVAAIECKVTNDQTNSVKRVNDVLKKATAWQAHWGSFVKTVAILQGVVAAKDIDRLCDANVHVFWSHDLDSFQAWIESQI